METPTLPTSIRRALADEHRLTVLHRLLALDAKQGVDFDRIIELAAAAMQAPIALVTLLDTEREWPRSCFGLNEGGMPIETSFSAYAVAGEGPLVLADASTDPRFAANPLVAGAQRLRFYAGVPLVVSGARVGALCVFDRAPRDRPAVAQLEQLKALAGLAASLFTLKEATRSGALAQAALAREEKRRAVALEAANLASWVWDIRSDAIECDTLMPVLFNLAPTNRLRPRDILLAIDPRDALLTQSRFRDAVEGGDEFVGECRVKGFEPPRWIAIRGRVIERDAEARPTLIFGVTFDVSERKFGEERQRLLLRELNHRVKNTLATIQALASQTVRHAERPSDFLPAFSARLHALGLAHSLLSDREWRGIGIGELVQIEVKPFDTEAHPRILISGANLFLSPDQALGLGLILHELSSNALKYGSLSVPAGTVDLSWHAEGRKDARRLVLTWREGGGPAVVPPERHGFGSILISRSLAKVISSEVKHEFRPEGVFAEISMPLEDTAAGSGTTPD
jgi:two-component sensor histidine kinase